MLPHRRQAGGPYLNLPQKLGAPGLDFQTWERRMSEALHPMSPKARHGAPIHLGLVRPGPPARHAARPCRPLHPRIGRTHPSRLRRKNGKVAYPRPPKPVNHGFARRATSMAVFDDAGKGRDFGGSWHPERSAVSFIRSCSRGFPEEDSENERLPI